MSKLLKFVSGAGAALLPSLTLAASSKDGISGALSMVMGLITQLIPIVIGIAVLWFLWGVLKYVVAKSEDEQKEARMVMLYGIITLFVMVSVWGLVNVLADTLKLDTVAPNPPQIPGVK